MEISKIIELRRKLHNEPEKSKDKQLECSVRLIEEFPVTVNDYDCVQKVRRVAKKLGLDICEPPEPFRWSEDFGYYTKKIKGAFFGVGSGENVPGLHTDEYEFNDAIIPVIINLYMELLKN